MDILWIYSFVLLALVAVIAYLKIKSSSEIKKLNELHVQEKALLEGKVEEVNADFKAHQDKHNKKVEVLASELALAKDRSKTLEKDLADSQAINIKYRPILDVEKESENIKAAAL